METGRTNDDDIDALFALPGDEFVAARDALAKNLKAAGTKDMAGVVKKLRRPTVAAAALNWLAREEAKDLAALVRIGDRLRAAHETLAAGGGGSDVRKATADRRRLTAALADRAVAHLGAAGEGQRTAITHTLDAAVADAAAGIAVRSGRLTKELDAPSGFGAELAFAPPSLDEARPPREDRRAARRARRQPAAPDEPTVDPPEPVAPVAAVDLTKRRAELRREADAAAETARAAARDTADARAEVARIRHQLLDAEAALHRAEERARLTQWKSAAAQTDLRNVGE